MLSKIFKLQFFQSSELSDKASNFTHLVNKLLNKLSIIHIHQMSYNLIKLKTHF